MEGKVVIFVIALTFIGQTGAQSLAGRQLKITTIASPPLIIVNNDTVARWRGKYEGILIDVLKQVASMANFTYNIHTVRDGRYGFLTPDGVWTGMIGEVINNVADVAVAPLTVASFRAKRVTYTHPVMDAGLRILYRKSPPPVDNASLLMLLAPFTTGLWFMIIACFVVASFVFFAIGKLSPYEAQPDNPKLGDNVPFTTTLANTALYSVTSFMHQGKGVPRSVAGRVMTIFWWIFTTLVVTTFAANFTAFLLSKSPDIRTLPFMTFDELSRQTTIKYGLPMNGATKVYFQNSTRSMEQRMYKQMSSAVPSVFTQSYAEAVSRVRNENFAFIGEGPMLSYVSNRAPCDTMVIGGPLGDRVYGFVCSQNSNICNMLNPYILRLTQSHFISETIRKWMYTGECSSTSQRMIKIRSSPIVDAFGRLGIRLETQMSFGRFSAAFFVLLGGILLSLVVLGGEIFYVNKFGLPQK